MIYRLPVLIGITFMAPRNVTFYYQAAREQFCIWFNDLTQNDCEYIIVGTGHTIPWSCELVASALMPDGFHIFHLVRRIT